MSDPHLREKCCLIGEAVGGDPTHFMVARAIERLGLDWRFLSFQVAPERLADAVLGADALGLRGVRLQGRHRDGFATADAPVDLTERARRTGRVTHLTRRDDGLQGDDATGPALVDAVAGLGDLAGAGVVLLGAGGAAPSVADAMIEVGVASLAVADPAGDAALELAHRLTTRAESRRGDAGEGPACVVTPLRWDRGWIELPEASAWIVSTASWPKEENAAVAETLGPELQSRHTVVDLGVGSSRSPLLLAAEERGAAALDGLPVLVNETAMAVESWTGESIDRGVLRDAAEEFLGV